MKNKIIIIVLLLLSITLIGLGSYISLNNNKIKDSDKEAVEKVLKQINNDLGKDGYTIKLKKVDGSNYIFNQVNDSTKEVSMIITYNAETEELSVEDKETISDINVEQ